MNASRDVPPSTHSNLERRVSMIIYQITNQINGNFYIGKTVKTIEDRFKRHCRSVQQGSNTYLHRAMRLYGPESFTIQIIESDVINLNEREIFYISKLNPTYNMTTGGDGGDTSSSPNFIESIKKRSSTKGLRYEEMYGEELGAELRRKRTQSNIARGKRSSSTCDKISNTRKERIIRGELIPNKPPKQSLIVIQENLKKMNGIFKCDVCGTESNLGNISRWHNSNCKKR